MEHHFEAFEDLPYSDLPVISPNMVDGCLADLENLPPIAPFSEVKLCFHIITRLLIHYVAPATFFTSNQPSIEKLIEKRKGITKKLNLFY